MRHWSNLFWNRYICWETLSAIHWTKIPENWIKWNGNFRKGRFENLGQPLEVVLFPGNVEIPERFCPIWHSISNFGQTLGPSPSRDCREKRAESSLYRYQCNICFIFGCFAVFLTAFVRGNSGTMGTLYHPMLPSISRKQSGTTWTVSVNEHTSNSMHMAVRIVLVGTNSVISKTSLSQVEPTSLDPVFQSFIISFL